MREMFKQDGIYLTSIVMNIYEYQNWREKAIAKNEVTNLLRD